MVDREGFVAGPEVEDPAFAPGPGAAGSKDFAAFVPTDIDQFIGCRDVEMFPVHLGMLELAIGAQAVGDWVPGIDAPDTLQFGGFTPQQPAIGTDLAFEDF